MYLTEAEWHVMECLWNKEHLTGREAVSELQEGMGWSRWKRHSLIELSVPCTVRRLENKGAVSSQTNNGLKTFIPLVKREDAALQETEDFLDRIYKGSLSLMVSSLTEKKALPKEEIDKLYNLLKQLEEGE